MSITKASPLSGKVHTLEIDITSDQYMKWRSGELIQNVMPNLTDYEREFLITGLLKEEFDAL